MNAQLIGVAEVLADIEKRWGDMVHGFFELLWMNVLLLQITIKHIKDTDVKDAWKSHTGNMSHTAPCQLLGLLQGPCPVGLS